MDIIFKMLKNFLILVLLAWWCGCTKLAISLDPQEKKCFFQILQAQQKYTLDVKPRSPGKYEVEVSRMVDGGWSSLYRKQTQTGLESLNLHKLAPSDSTYSFCFSNTDEKRIALALNIQSGLELMEFEMLPDKSDSENLERELGWLKSEKARLFESLERMQGLRASSDGLQQVMSTKVTGFAILGLISLIVVNVLFYRELRKTFKERKLI